MIRLRRPPRPTELDDQKKADLTAEFKSTDKPVWNVEFIRQPLLASSHNKCAYCETIVIEESKYMEVEHFRYKHQFKELVVQWDNLLPSCKRCNGKKGTHNVDTQGMIINPYDDNPADHLYFDNYRLRHKDEIGRNTIDTLYLNDTIRMVSVRFKIGEAIAGALEILRSKTEYLINEVDNVRLRNRVTRGMEKLLEECLPSAQFSALSATILIRDPDYIWIKKELDELGLWGELQQLHVAAEALALPY